MSAATCVTACAPLRCCVQQERPQFARTAPGPPPRRIVGLGWNATAQVHRQQALQRPGQVRNIVAAAAASSGGEAAAAAEAAPTSSGGHGSGRHAFLHDFCMCLPYGALVAAGGLVGKLFGWGQPAVVMMVVGGLQLALSTLSLKTWRQNKSCAPYTFVEAVLASWLAYYAYRAVQQGVSQLFMGALLGLSAAMALFLFYNILAGGNPTKKKQAV